MPLKETEFVTPHKAPKRRIVNKRICLENRKCTSKEEKQMCRGAYDKFPDFFRMGTIIDSTHMKL